MLDDINRLISKWMTGRRSQQIMSVVVEAMTQARQKVRSSDSPFRSLARKLIDRAEDAYQDAIYQLKDGEPQLCFENCKQGLKYLSMAMLHLSELNGKTEEPVFEPDSPCHAVVDLSEAIAKFKTSVEYTNCDVDAPTRERLVEVVHLFNRSIRQIKDGNDDDAGRTAKAGLLWMYFLGKELEEKLKTQVVDSEALERCSSSSASRIINLIDQLGEARKMLSEASIEAHGRIRTYLNAAHNTLERCLDAYTEGDSDEVAQCAKAGAMEVRMAKRLIDYSSHPGSGPEPEEDEELQEAMDEKAHEFRWRVARLQRLLSEHDEDFEGVARRLAIVSAHFARARNLMESGDYSEADRYARSAHLDIDFARQLLTDKHATYSDII